MIKLFEKFTNYDDVKDAIFIYAIETYKPDIIDFFLNKGYDINTYDALIKASYDIPTFKFMLEKGADVEYLDDILLKKLDIQKALIDYGYEQYIHDTVGFHNSLKNDPKYVDVVQRAEDMKKYNL